MFQTFISRIGWFVALWLLQVLVFNHVHIFGYATPMPYVYLLLIFPGDTPRWVYVLTGFLMGLLIDLFASTPGMAAASMTLAGLLAPLSMNLFAPTDREDEAFLPSRKTMKWGGFLRFALCTSFVHCLCFFLLEAFSFFDTEVLLINIAGSTLLTTVFIAALELIRER